MPLFPHFVYFPVFGNPGQFLYHLLECGWFLPFLEAANFQFIPQIYIDQQFKFNYQSAHCWTPAECSDAKWIITYPTPFFFFFLLCSRAVLVFGFNTKRATLTVCFGWEGWKTLFPVSITATLTCHGHLWVVSQSQLIMWPSKHAIAITIAVW